MQLFVGIWLRWVTLDVARARAGRLGRFGAACFFLFLRPAYPARLELVVRAATGALVEIQRQALWRAHPLVRDAHEHPVCVGKADH